MANNELGIWKPGPNPLVEPITPLDQMMQNMADTTRDAIVSASAAAPSHYPGRIWYNTTTKRTYKSDGTTWKYQGGGNGDLATGGSNGLDLSVGGFQQPAGTPTNPSRGPLRLFRTAEGLGAIAGQLQNVTAGTGGWSVNVQYQIGKIHALAAEFIPPYDVVGIGMVTIAGVIAGEPGTFIVRGSATGGAYSGAAGDIMWQPSSTRGAITTLTAHVIFPYLVWELPV